MERLETPGSATGFETCTEEARCPGWPFVGTAARAGAVQGSWPACILIHRFVVAIYLPVSARTESWRMTAQSSKEAAMPSAESEAGAMRS